MKTIRPSVFETNSSSVHTLCLCSEADYDKFTNKELFWKYENLVTLDEAYEEFCKYLAEHADDGDYSLHSFDDKVPSKELFEKAEKTAGCHRLCPTETEERSMERISSGAVPRIRASGDSTRR